MSDGAALLRSDDGGSTWIIRAKLPKAIGLERLVASRLGRRLGRVGFHHFLKTGDDAGLAIAHKHVFRLISGDPELKRTAVLNGSRPLAFCRHDNAVYYGEYCSNPQRTQVHIWMSGLDGHAWQPVWRFNGVRHVHGVFFDPYTPAVWVTTGDENNESAIWVSRDSFQTLEQVAGGSQQHRAVQLLFTDKHVYFGSDSPGEQNHIYRMDRKGVIVERLAEVKSPVFYGSKVGQSLFFSTVIEPSSVNPSRHAEVWGTPDGENWRVAHRFRKDFWPMKYFQYGQVLFPAGPGDGEHLWCTPMATVYDQKSIRIKVDSLF